MYKKGMLDEIIPILVIIFVGTFAILILQIFTWKAAADSNNLVEAQSSSLEMRNKINYFLNQEVIYNQYGDYKYKMVDLLATVNPGEKEKIEFLKKETEEYFKSEKDWFFGLKIGDQQIFEAKSRDQQIGIYRLEISPHAEITWDFRT